MLEPRTDYHYSGYIPGASALTVVGDEVRKLKDRAKSGNYQEEVIYLLDRKISFLSIVVCLLTTLDL